ncbi:SURF1 family protein [Agrococcus beijingensis]|uniref:SURF1 family cytochrome oxidase biogenesis protein n=1 Tax=Agrococcus beijingensis TaxID=3068634 RepID=UPI002740C89F|nr:SURF1 family protein [Agrococcus sp. REN33]
MLALLRQRRWLGYIALATVVAVVCCLIGVWQWNRREEAIAAIERLETNYDRTPVAVTDALPDPGAFDADQQWTPVVLEGEYLLDEQLLLRGRWRGGEIGFDVIAPFRTDDGRVFIVDRGWIDQASNSDAPVSQPTTPGGPTTVVARLRPNEGDIPGRGAPEGQIASVNLPALAESMGEPLYTAAYGLLVSEDGGTPGDVRVASRPVLDEGPHLSYALQWFVFAVFPFVAVWWGMREELRGDAPPPPPKRSRTTDADVEDQILDRT